MKRKITITTLLLILLLVLTPVAYSATKGFKDVKPSQWHYEYVMKASEMKIISGYNDGTFKPNENLTRAQLAKIIVEYDKRINTEIINTAKLMSTDEKEVINAVANAIPATVKISSDTGNGSGFFAKSNYILTNAHVVGDEKKVKIVVSTGEELDGTVVSSNRPKDIAIVKVEKNFNYLTFSTQISVGQNAIAIGNPLGQDGTVTKGIVSKLDITNIKESKMFQMDTHINSGSSGGAVINSSGQVIGMSTGKLIGDHSEAIEGISFAISSIELQNYLKVNVK